MSKQLTVAFSIAILLTVTVVYSADLSQTADGAKAQGNFLPETGSKKVCGDKLCSEVNQPETTKAKHSKSEDKTKHGSKKSISILPNQIMSGKYKITVDWIHEFPVTGESNGFAILVSDTSIKAAHGKDKAKHGESSHEEKEMGDCRCITLLKSSVPKAELFENGVSGLENHLTITVSASNQEMIMPLSADELSGRYYALFIPAMSGQYDVKLSGMISGTSVNHTFQPDHVLEKSELLQFP